MEYVISALWRPESAIERSLAPCRRRSRAQRYSLGYLPALGAEGRAGPGQAGLAMATGVRLAPATAGVGRGAAAAVEHGVAAVGHLPALRAE